MRKIILILIFQSFVYLPNFFSYAKQIHKFKYISDDIDDDDDDEEDDDKDNTLSKKYRLGLRLSTGPSLSNFLSLIPQLKFPIPIPFVDPDTKKKYKIEYQEKLKIVSKRIPINIELFAGYKPLNWLGFDISIAYNIFEVGSALYCEGKVTRINIEHEYLKPYFKDFPHKYFFRFRNLDIAFKAMLFQGGLYEGLGFKITKMISGYIKTNINYKALQDPELADILEQVFLKSQKIDITSPKVSRLFYSILLYFGYEFSFGLNLETSIEIPLKLFSLIKQSSKLKLKSSKKLSDLFSGENDFLASGALLASRPIIYLSIGYNFMKLF